MRLLLVVNPAASAVTTRRRVIVEDNLAGDHELTVALTTGRDHATELARDAAAKGMDAVVVLGGDGTLNEAANGLVGTSTALAPLPAGSTNVYARTVGFENRLARAAGQLRQALATGSRRRIEVGRANDRYFLFHVGIGFDAAVVEQVEQRAALKRRVGQAVFVYAAVMTWFRHYDRSRPQFTVRTSEGGLGEEGHFSICLKTNPYTFFGPRPFSITPEAGLGRGLALLTFRDLSFGTVMGAMGSALATGQRLRGSEKVALQCDLDRVTIEGHGPFPYQVDGDYLGRVERLELTIERDCLDLILPTQEPSPA